MATVMLKPVFPPYVCIVCGVGNGRRWFVDMNFAIDNYFNPVNDGAIYLCDECWDGLSRAVGNQAQVLMLGEEPWDKAVAAEYTSEKELVFESPLISNTPQEVEVNNGTGLSSEGTGDTDPTITGDDQHTETIDSEPDTNIDDDAEPVREFREFFGKSV